MQDVGYQYLASGLCGLLISLCVGRLILRCAGARRATGREVHFHDYGSGRNAIPRVGGLCLVGGILAACVAAVWLPAFGHSVAPDFWAVAVSSLAMFALGFADDLRPLGAKRKLIFQILIALGAYWMGIQVNQFKNPLTGQPIALGIWAMPLTVLWLIGITNLINLIDGMDGLAAGIGLMLMGLLAWVGITAHDGFYSFVAVAAMGSLLGFLRFNFPPASIYLGDGGAYFLGFLIAVLSIETSNKGTIVAALTAPAIALALPVIDTTLAILRRGVKGLPLFRADRDHLHHKLVQRGCTRLRAVIILYSISLLALIFAVVLFVSEGQHWPIVLGAAFLVLLLPLRFLRLIPRFETFVSTLRGHWQLRGISRYALALSDWLQLEAERCASPEALWQEYAFVAKKLRFARVKLNVGQHHRIWQAPGASEMARHRSHRFSGEHAMSLEFFSTEQAMTQAEFEHVTELAAEAWIKAFARCGNANTFALKEADAPVATSDASWPSSPLPAAENAGGLVPA